MHGISNLNRGDFIGSIKYQVKEDTRLLLGKLVRAAKRKKHHMIVNPCGDGKASFKALMQDKLEADPVRGLDRHSIQRR